jgi:hypothetical protein
MPAMDILTIVGSRFFSQIARNAHPVAIVGDHAQLADTEHRAWSEQFKLLDEIFAMSFG